MEEKKRRMHALVARAVFVVALLGIWEYVAKSGMMGEKSELIFPSLEVIADLQPGYFRV